MEGAEKNVEQVRKPIGYFPFLHLLASLQTYQMVLTIVQSFAYYFANRHCLHVTTLTTLHTYVH